MLLLGFAVAGCGAPPDGVPAGRPESADFAPPPMPVAQSATQPERVGGGVVGGSPRDAATSGAGGAPAAAAPAVVPQGALAVPAGRKIIRNGSLQVEVSDLGAALDALRALGAAVGGYVAAEVRSGDAGRPRNGAITLRVPAERLDEAMAKASELGRVLELSVRAEDITEQYFDLEIQLHNRLALEAKLRQLLERPGNRLSDLLEVEREMARVRGEVEQLEGRTRLWDNQVGLATLNVLLAEPAPLLAGDRGGVWQALRDAFGQAGENFVATVAVVIAATGSLVPLGAALLVAFVAVRALWRRWRRSRA